MGDKNGKEKVCKAELCPNVARFTETAMEVGEGGFAGNGILLNAYQSPVKLSLKGITQDTVEVFDGTESFEITEQIEEKKRDGIIASSSEDGIGIGDDGTNEREINSRTNQLSNAAANGTVVVDVDKLFVKLVMGKPASMFFGKGFTVMAIDERIDISELSDKMADSKAFAHLKAPRVSREDLRPSKRLPGNPFLLVNANHPAFTNPIQTNASDSSISTNTGGAAFWSFSCA